IRSGAIVAHGRRESGEGKGGQGSEGKAIKPEEAKGKRLKAPTRGLARVDAFETALGSRVHGLRTLLTVPPSAETATRRRGRRNRRSSSCRQGSRPSSVC